MKYLDYDTLLKRDQLTGFAMDLEHNRRMMMATPEEKRRMGERGAQTRRQKRVKPSRVPLRCLDSDG